MEQKETFSAKISKGWGFLRYWIREYFGENEYARYVEAWKAAHHGKECTEGHHLMTEREFYQHRLDLKYGPGMQRC